MRAVKGNKSTPLMKASRSPIRTLALILWAMMVR